MSSSHSAIDSRQPNLPVASSINVARYWEALMALGAITDPQRPWTRRSFSPLFLQGRQWLRERFEQLGLRPHIDAAGNLIGRLEGSDPDAGCIMVGSHSDSVPGGGRFDGIAGVIAGLEVVASLLDANKKLRHTIEVIDFLAEEPSEYGVSCIGSRGLSGFLDAGQLSRTNAAGESLHQAMRRMGAEPDQLAGAVRRDVKAFYELHIEQGAVLENAALDLGIVRGIVGINRVAVSFKGQAAHAGTTPMALRRDALVAAATLVCEINRMALDLSNGDAYFVATAGQINVLPNATNVVPGEANIVFDIRSSEQTLLDQFVQDLQACAQAIAGAHRVVLSSFEQLSSTAPTACDVELMAHLRQSAMSRNYRLMDMTSGAGHDCAFMTHIAPSAMVFVPSREGKSHCPEEWTEPAQLAAGVATLYEAVCAFDAASLN
jgi:beta-ureidopropionase / N-carbamoyl-L-amino-acid hydrolase